MKKSRLLFCIVLVLVIALALFGAFKMIKKSAKASPKVMSEKTEIGGDTTGYRFDLRIFGSYNNKRINEIILVSNYKNKDMTININRINDTKEEKIEYLIKDSKFYQLDDGKLKEVKSVEYSNTDIYLYGIKNATDFKQTGTEKIGEEEYTVYKGKISSDVMNKILAETDLDYKVSKDTNIEVWQTKEGYVYKVYYRIEKLTVYASYFGYNKARMVDLDSVKS